jgi:uncharacterized protein Usg
MAHAPVVWQPGLSDSNKLFSLILNSALAWLCDGDTKHDGSCRMTRSEVELMLKGYGLTTAEMIYRMPDYRHVLNSFVWQDYDLAPDYPRLFEFIEYWQGQIEGPLHSVRFVHRKLIAPGEWRNVTGEFTYH